MLSASHLLLPPPCATEAELLPLLHNKLSVLRLSTDLLESKLTVATSLALLSPTWTQDLQAMAPHQKLRMLQAGPGCFWRLVYLVFTGQHTCFSFSRCINSSQATFLQLLPDFADWLHR